MAAAVLRQTGAAVARSGATISEAAPTLPSVTAAAAPFVVSAVRLARTVCCLRVPADKAKAPADRRSCPKTQPRQHQRAFVTLLES